MCLFKIFFLFFLSLFLFFFFWNMKRDRGNTFPHCHPLINSLGLLLARFHLQPGWRAAGRADSQRRNDGLGSNSALLPRRNLPSKCSDFERTEYVCHHKIPTCIRTQCNHWAEHLPSVDIKLKFSENILENTLIFNHVRPATAAAKPTRVLKEASLNSPWCQFLCWRLSNVLFSLFHRCQSDFPFPVLLWKLK